MLLLAKKSLYSSETQKTCCFKKSKSQRMLFFLPKKPDTSSQLLMFQVFFLSQFKFLAINEFCSVFFFVLVWFIWFSCFLSICVIFLWIYLFSVDLGDFQKTPNFTDFSSRCSKHFKKDLQRFQVILRSCDFLRFVKIWKSVWSFAVKLIMRFVENLQVKKILLISWFFVIFCELDFYKKQITKNLSRIL